MSRSRKKSPCFSWVAYSSNKKSKRICNRLFRKVAKRCFLNGRNFPLKVREVMDNWEFSSDGMPRWRNGLDKRYMRK